VDSESLTDHSRRPSSRRCLCLPSVRRPFDNVRSPHRRHQSPAAETHGPLGVGLVRVGCAGGCCLVVVPAVAGVTEVACALSPRTVHVQKYRSEWP